MTPRNNAGVCWRIASFAMTLAILLADQAGAATSAFWDSRPYRVAIELDLSESGLSTIQEQRLRERLVDRIEFRLGRFWLVELGESDNLPTAGEDEEGVTPFDKRIAARVVGDGIGGMLRVVEHDITLDHAGVPVEVSYAGSADLPERLYSAMLVAFRPIARFVRDPKKPNGVTLTYRANDLAPSSGVGMAKSGQLLLPFRRRVDRSGQPVEGGTKGVRWTYLMADDTDDTAKPTATVISHTRRPFGTRPSAKLQQLALAAPVNPEMVTRLRLRSIEDPDVPLPGYEVLLAPPGETSREPLGFTDNRGEIALPMRPGVWTAHVKCGTLTVASVPVAPGVDEAILAPLVDERSRLRAELEVTSLREELIDTVARRKILGQRIRKYVDSEQPDRAAKLLSEMDELRGRTQFNRDLGVIERGAQAGHPVAQQRLAQLFDKTRSLINTALDPRESRDLSQLVGRAKRDAEIRDNDTATPAGSAGNAAPGG